VFNTAGATVPGTGLAVSGVTVAGTPVGIGQGIAHPAGGLAGRLADRRAGRRLAASLRLGAGQRGRSVRIC
jgi:hypothetical protein